MTESNNSFPSDASAVFALMKSFTEQQQQNQQQQSQNEMMPPTSMEGSDSRETEELKNRLLAAAMSMLGGGGGGAGSGNTNPPMWFTPESQIPMPAATKSDAAPPPSGCWEDMNLPSHFFPFSSEATTSPPNDFPFPNPFMMLPPGLQYMGGKCLPSFMNGNKDEDFCELCQKHFCNKYYLRKHKNDVHRIPTEPFSQMRKREIGSGESDDNAGNQGDMSPSTNKNEWMNVLASSAVTAQQLGDNRRNPLENFSNISITGEVAPQQTEKESFPVWMPKTDPKTSRVELGENANFTPPVVSTESTPTSNLSSTTASSKTLNPAAMDVWMSKLEPKTSRVELGENANFIPPAVSSESTPASNLSSTTASGKTLNPGAMDMWMPKPEPKTSRVELGENATFIPPVVSSESAPTSNPSSTSASSKTLNPGAMDMFKSSMAAAKLADRVTCELCKKELCNKYFLRTHKIKVHGLSPQEVGIPASRSSASKHSEKMQNEGPNQGGLEAFNLTPPIQAPFSFMNPLLSSQFPAPLGTLPPWLSPQAQTMIPEMPKTPTSSSQEDQKKDPVMQLMAANSLVNCPLCEKTIGPRLFLPTHLTSVHGLSPMDPSFFIFILSARTLEGQPNGESDSSTAKMTPTSTSERGSPLSSSNFQQLPNSMSLMRLPSATTSGVEIMCQGMPQFSVPNSMNGMLPPPSFSMGDMGGVSNGGATGLESLPLMATAPSTGPLLLPPPLGLLSNPPGIYPGAHGMPQTPANIQQPQQQPQPGGMNPLMNPGTMTPNAVASMTTNPPKWTPMQFGPAALNGPKRVLSSGSASGSATRKSPNQMRVLCDICNKWICNKYFLRTHKANKHGITDQSNPVLTSSAQGALGLNKGGGASVLPLDFSKPGKTLASDGNNDSLGPQQQHQSIMNPWSFSTPNAHSQTTRSPNILSLNTDSTNPSANRDSSAEVLNLSLKPSPQLTVSGSEIKHGVDQFLSNFPPSFQIKRRLKSRRRNLRLCKQAALVLTSACRRLNTIQRRSPEAKRHHLHQDQQMIIDCNQTGEPESIEDDEQDPSTKNWSNNHACQVCKATFIKRSQLEAHYYSTGHQRAPRSDPISSNFFQTSPEVYNLSMDSSAQLPSDCSVDEVSSGQNAWWSTATRQQKWPINFTQGKLVSHHHHQTSGSNSSPAEQYCSYQASHHMIQPPLFNETTTTPTI